MRKRREDDRRFGEDYWRFEEAHKEGNENYTEVVDEVIEMTWIIGLLWYVTKFPVLDFRSISDLFL
jgi:hypothetical protein